MQKERVEEEEKESNHELDMESSWQQSQNTTKRPDRSYYTGATKASEIQNMLTTPLQAYGW